MIKTSRLFVTLAMVTAAAFAVSACKWGAPKDKDPIPASSATVESAPATPDASATPPASGAVAAEVSSAVPASSAAVETSAKKSK